MDVLGKPQVMGLTTMFIGKGRIFCTHDILRDDYRITIHGTTFVIPTISIKIEEILKKRKPY